jgi:5-methylthioadenosine/S-adenosylhomocysteine deaminase
MRAGHGLPPVAAWAASQLRLGVGSGTGESAASRDLWTPIRLLALLSQTADAAPQADPAWEALTAATSGGAAALGLDGEIGTLEQGKWADVCCLDLETPSMQRQPLEGPRNAATRLVFNGGRDLVSDVWVAGRHLLHLGAFTRLDWATRGSR